MLSQERRVGTVKTSLLHLERERKTWTLQLPAVQPIVSPLSYLNIPIHTQDRVDYKTLLDANNLRNTCQHGRPGKWAAIVIQDEYNESPYEAYEYIYAPVCVCACSMTIPFITYH